MELMQIVTLAIAAGFVFSAFHRLFSSDDTRAEKTGELMYREDE